MKILAKTSLRLRITLAVIALFAVVVAALAIGTAFALRGYLVAGVDENLSATTSRALRALQEPLRPGPGPGDAVALPGQAPGTLAAFVNGGSLLLAGVLDPSGQTLALTDEQRASLADSVDGQIVGTAFSADIAGLGGYRLIGVAT